MRHYTKVEDLTKEEYMELCKRAEYFAQGLKENKDFTNLCPGKVMATMFFQESARTSSMLQGAMITLGGGWIGIAGTQGTYIGTGEESMEDFLKSYAMVSDIMGVRHKTLELEEIRDNFPVPLINGMSGKSEHTLAALGWVCLLSKYYGDLEEIKIGIYGMPKSSRPIKAFIKAMSYFKAKFYIDSVVEELGVPEDIKQFAEKNGATFVDQPLEDFISEVGFLLVTEGLPQAGEDENTVKKYNEKYRVLDAKDFDKMREGSYFLYCMPSTLSDGRTTNIKEMEYDKRNISWDFLWYVRPVTMALITHLLDVKVEY